MFVEAIGAEFQEALLQSQLNEGFKNSAMPSLLLRRLCIFEIAVYLGKFS